jgi:hypothetical protein
MDNKGEIPLICQGIFENLQGNGPERELIAIMYQVSDAKSMAAPGKIAAPEWCAR